MKKVGYLLLILLAFVMSGCGNFKEKEKEEKPEEKEIVVLSITKDEVKKIVDDYINNPDVDVIDVRSEEEYLEGHIEGAINIPSGYLSDIHIDYERTLIIYASNERRSRDAALELMNLGYKKVYSMGGIDDWEYELVEN